MALQRFTGGSASARDKLNALVDAHAQTSSLRGDETFVGTSKTSAGTVIRVDVRAVAARMPQTQPLVFPVWMTAVVEDVFPLNTVWTYDIRHGLGPITDDCIVKSPAGTLATYVNTTLAPHSLPHTPRKATRGLAHYDRDGYLVIDWHDAIEGRVFPVKVFLDGGNAGSAAATCTFTYHVEALDGTDLSDGHTPYTPRLANTMYVAATGYGSACYDGTTLILLTCNEVPYVEAH